MHQSLPPQPPTAPSTEYVLTVAQHAEEAFWQTIAVAFPECKSGDFPPDADAKFTESCRDALRSWLTFNHPAYDQIGAR